MSVAQPASSLVVGALTAGGQLIVQALSEFHENQTTHSSFHRIESFGKFPAEECSEQPSEIVQPPQVIDTELTSFPTAEAEPEKEQSPQNPPPTEEAPIASSGQFDRKRTASLAAAILSAEHTPGHKATIQFVSPSGAQSTLIEASETVDDTAETGQLPSSEAVVTSLLFTLRALQMSDPDRHTSAVRRLQELERELRDAGAVCPPDHAVSDAVAKVLASATANSDVQIRVNSSRQTTTTKTVYETETPGMQGLDADVVQRLQQQLISNISPATAPPSTAYPEAPRPATDQKHESMAEGFTTEDGSTVVSKKMTRVVTTTRTTLPGEASEPNAGDLIRLKVNEQVYSGSVDPSDQHIHLVPITKLDQPSQPQ